MADDDGLISLCTWEFIWSFFLHCPEIRSWLFRNNQPSMAHTVESLMNGPLLNGFVFTTLESSQSHILPDVGDLDTAFIHSNGPALGFAFGYQNILPIVPVIYDITKDNHFSDATVITRRTAYQKIDFPSMTFHIRVDFAWMVSGSLVVTSSVQAMRHFSDSPTFLRPAIDDLEVRFFFPEEAKRLHDLVTQIDQLPIGNGECSQSIKRIPLQLLNPLCSVRVRVWDQTHTSDGNLLQIEKSAYTQFVTRLVPSSLLTASEMTASQLFGIAHAFACMKDFTAQSQAISRHRPALLWDQLRSALPNRKRNGIYRSIFTIRDGTMTSERKMFWRASDYVFLCKKDFSIHGRIQRLCTQLGINYANPNTDGFLQRASDSDNLRDIGTSEHSSIDSHETHSLLQPGNSNLSKLIDTKPHVSDTEQQPVFEVKKISGQGVYPKMTSTESQSSVDCFASRVEQCEGTPSQISIHEHNTPYESEDTISITALEISKAAADYHSDVKSCQLESSEETVSATKEEEREVEMLDVTSSIPLRRLPTNGNIDLCSLTFTERKCRSPGVRELWPCALCGIIIRGKKGNLKRHIAFRHNDIRRFKCEAPDCGRKFHNRVNLKRHIVAVHEGRPFRCPKCPRDFKIKENMEAHFEKTHVKCASLLACEFCGSCFGYRSSLNRHKRTVHRCEKVELSALTSKSEPSSITKVELS